MFWATHSCTYRTKTYPASGGGHLTERAFRGNLTEKVEKKRRGRPPWTTLRSSREGKKKARGGEHLSSRQFCAVPGTAGTRSFAVRSCAALLVVISVAAASGRRRMGEV